MNYPGASAGVATVACMTKGPCSIDGCSKPVLARGWCSTHYVRWQKSGDPLITLRDVARLSRGSCPVVEHGYECGRQQSCKGLCKKHYERQRKTGSVFATRHTGLTLEQRFWSYVDKAGPGECWLWLGRLYSQGYGCFDWQRRPWLAHRVAWLLTYGALPDTDTLDHVCHNTAEPRCFGGPSCQHRRCVNPSHLLPRSRSENRLASPNGLEHQTHCHKGHPYTPENTYFNSRGWRRCRTCTLARQAANRRDHGDEINRRQRVNYAKRQACKQEKP